MPLKVIEGDPQFLIVFINLIRLCHYLQFRHINLLRSIDKIFLLSILLKINHFRNFGWAINFISVWAIKYNISLVMIYLICFSIYDKLNFPYNQASTSLHSVHVFTLKAQLIMKMNLANRAVLLQYLSAAKLTHFNVRSLYAGLGQWQGWFP